MIGRGSVEMSCETCFQPFRARPFEADIRHFCCRDCDTSSRRFTALEVARVRELVDAGVIYREIAADVGRSPGGVGRLINRMIHAGRMPHRGPGWLREGLLSA